MVLLVREKRSDVGVLFSNWLCEGLQTHRASSKEGDDRVPTLFLRN